MRLNLQDSGNNQQVTLQAQQSQSQSSNKKSRQRNLRAIFHKFQLASTLLIGASTILSPVVSAKSSDDILEGKGTFDTPEVDSSWIAVNQDEAGFPAAYDVKVNIPDPTDVDVDQNNYYLELKKRQGAKGFFDDAYTFIFTEKNADTGIDQLKPIRPRHLSFQIQTLENDGESCDVRLYSVKPRSNDEGDNGSDSNVKKNDGEETKDEEDHSQTSGRLRRLEDGDQNGTLLGANGQDEDAGDSQDDPESNGDNQENSQNGDEDGDQEDDNSENQDSQDDDKEDQVRKIEAAPNGPNMLWEKVEFSDLILFRLGWFNYMKLNTGNMIQKFEKDVWYTVNLILNYETQRVSVYITDGDGAPQGKTSVMFFTKRTNRLQEASALSLYSLTPGNTARFRNIRVCEDICAGTEIEGVVFEDLDGAASLMRHFTSLSYTSLAGMAALALAIIA